MALGGGFWSTQNKVLPGSYINFVSAAKASATLSDRGVVAMPIELGWGPDGEVFTVTSDEFQKNTAKLFGYDYTAAEMTGLRDLFMYAKTVHFYRVNGSAKAANTYCTAKYKGSRGNEIKTVITESETAGKFDVETYFDNVLVDEQKAAATTDDLTANDFVDWKTDVTLEAASGLACTSGADGTTADLAYQAALDAFEAYSFNVLTLISTNSTLKGLFSNYTKRLRDELGIKFQCVLHQYTTADHEGVISVENGETANLCYWVAGAEAGCKIEKSLANKIYDGEFTVSTAYTQAQLEAALLAGKFIFHKVGDKVRVLDDINCLVTTTTEKGEDFKSNQTIRVIDQIGNDIAKLFNEKYLGQYPNDEAGRISLWNDIVKHHQEMERLRAIEDFDPEAVKVEKGEKKKAVVVTDYVTPVNCMTKLYMTIVVA